MSAAFPHEALWRTLETIVETTTKNDERILGLLNHVTDRIIVQDAEIAELREGLAALSNRIEALTQAGLHSVKA